MGTSTPKTLRPRDENRWMRQSVLQTHTARAEEVRAWSRLVFRHYEPTTKDPWGRLLFDVKRQTPIDVDHAAISLASAPKNKLDLPQVSNMEEEALAQSLNASVSEGKADDLLEGD